MNAFRRLVYDIRAWLCEIFAGWALAVAPKGYVPSFIETAVNFYRWGKKEAQTTPKDGEITSL